jgi:hypothetical protein
MRWSSLTVAEISDRRDPEGLALAGASVTAGNEASPITAAPAKLAALVMSFIITFL